MELKRIRTQAAVIVFLLFSPVSLAIDSSIVARDLQGGPDRILSELISTYQHLQAEKTSERKRFEDLQVYEERVSVADRKIRALSGKRFVINFVPDRIDIDWHNSALIIFADFPIAVLRARGEGVRQVRIVANADPGTLRQAVAFPHMVTVEMEFQLGGTGALHAKNTTVRYLHKILYEESI